MTCVKGGGGRAGSHGAHSTVAPTKPYQVEEALALVLSQAETHGWGGRDFVSIVPLRKRVHVSNSFLCSVNFP
jgi:hypothetical protein